MKISAKERNKIDRFLNGNGVSDLIKKGFFESDIPYPKREDFKVRATCEHCGSTYKDEDAETKYKAAMTAYREDCQAMHRRFEYALIRTYGLDYESNSARAAFEMAWNNHHSSGLYEVYTAMEDYSYLVLKAKSE